MTDLVLWRHGMTDYNAAGRVQGQVDIPLNQVGQAQAEAAAPGIAALAPSAIISSPLGRARQTAQALADLTGLTVQVEAELIERSFGQWEGLAREQMESGWPEEYARWRQGLDPRGVGVETRAATAARVGGAFERLMAGVAGAETGPVVVVAHGAAITLGATHLLGLDPSCWFGLRGLDNCHYGRLRSSGRAPGWMLVEWNAAGTMNDADFVAPRLGSEAVS